MGDLSESLELRWRGVTFESRFFLLLYTSRQVLHVFIQCMVEMSRTQFLLMTLHHLLSVMCFGGGLVTSRMQFWACLDGVCEFSTIFLNNIWLFKEVTIGGKQLKESLPGWVYTLNGILLW